MLTERSRLGDESLDEGLDDRDKDDLGLVGAPAESSTSGYEQFLVKWLTSDIIFILFTELVFYGWCVNYTASVSRGHCYQMDTLSKNRHQCKIFQKMIMDGFWASFNLGLVTKIVIRTYCVPGVMMRDRPETEADFGTLLAGDLGFSGVSSWWAIRRDAPLLKDGLVPVLLLLRRIRRRLETTPSKIRGYRALALVFYDSKLTAETMQGPVFVRLTFLLGRYGEARHDVKALGAVHYQWAGAALRLGWAGRSTRTQTVREKPVNSLDVSKAWVYEILQSLANRYIYIGLM